MEPYQLWIIIASCITLITGGFGWVLGFVKANERRIRELEIKVAVMQAVIEERKK